MTHEVVLQGYNVKPGSLQLGTFDSYGIEKIHVTADDSWDGLAIVVTFNPPEGDAVEVRVPEDGTVDVPPEATTYEGKGTIVFCGVDSGVQRITKTMGYVVITHANVGTDTAFTPSEDLAAQVLNAALSAERSSTEANTAAQGAQKAAENAASAAQASAESASKAAAEAAAAKPYTESAKASAEAARDSENQAQQSSTEATAAKNAAQNAQAGAESSAAAAAKSAKEAAASAVNLDNAVNTATQKAAAASASAAAAKASENAAANSEAATKTYAESARTAKNSAAASAETANAAKDSASASARDAAASKIAAAASEKNAAKSANSAADSAAAAKKSAENADNTANSIKDSMTQISENKEAASKLKEDIENTNSILEENLVRISANLINPDNMLENTAITISNRISTSSNTTYKSYLNIPVKAGESYYIGNSHRVACVIDDAENKLVLQSNTQNKTDPFIFNVEKSGLLCVCFYMTEEKPWVALAEKETEYEEYGSKLLQEWLKLQIEKYGYSNPLKGKTIYNFGDSISNGQGNLVGDKRLGPAELVALDNDMICTDFAVSGSTMSTAGGGNYILKRINDAISASPITPDFVLLAGGINDLKVTSVGDFSEPSSDDDFGEKYISLLDTSNFSGAFETAIYRILNAWPGTQLIYMTEHKMPSHYNDGTETLYQTAKKICKKWCVSILDMWNSGGLNMSVLANNKAYGTGDVNLDGTHTDTTHPNGEAYRLYYVPKLKSKLLECCPKTN